MARIPQVKARVIDRAAQSPPDAAPGCAETDLAQLVTIAGELGAESLTVEASAEQRRLAEGRFFVACVGQFKRGKSTLVNALVGQDILPVGVVPVTSVITILRDGPTFQGIVRFVSGRDEPLPPDQIAAMVDERLNPGNVKGVVAVELCLPAPVLSNGLCLVDTPGLGSVFAENTNVTRAFVPHVDVAMLVLGPDPPISGDELELLEALSHEAGEVVIVLNKADQAPREHREEVVTFTTRVVEQRLKRPVGRIFEVSALERLEQREPTRDWAPFEDLLRGLAARRTGLVASAVDRARQRLARRLLGEIAAQNAALRQPIDDTAARAARLRRAVEDADRSLHGLRFLFDAVEVELGQSLEQYRLEFIRAQQPVLSRSLETWIGENSERSTGGSLRTSAFDEVRRLVEQAIAEWFERLEPEVIALYQHAVNRFVTLAGEYVNRVAAEAGVVPGALDAGSLDEYARPMFHFADLMSLTAGSPLTWCVDRAGPREWRGRSVARHATAYLEHLVESNSHRVENDFRERTARSRRQLERSIRQTLAEALGTAERALSVAVARQSMAEREVKDRLDHLSRLRDELTGLDQ